ncbi:MAG TPA: 4Fe-4S dicluster domain-containing protein, partial [Candidatus Acidoferrum sp.]|nr:4Fe-4S dicluster domain-containing protein [Candidatus Acidoferrum sp.]
MTMLSKREFLKGLILFLPAGGLLASVARQAGGTPEEKKYDPANHFYGMGIEVDKCIGCSRCVEACKAENDVPKEPFFFRTWVERYVITKDHGVIVESINVASKASRETPEDDRDVLRSFFVPKLCNHCANPPCVQVCPVGATFSTKDGVVLVDGNR